MANIASGTWTTNIFNSILVHAAAVADGDTMVGNITLVWDDADEYQFSLYDADNNLLYNSGPRDVGQTTINYTFTDAYPDGVKLIAEYLTGPSAGLPIEDGTEFSIEADDPPVPVATSYNCACDDEYPTRTLAQMREFLMVRLGWGAMVATPLPGVAITLNSFLRDAQEQIYRQYKVFRLERYFTWPMEQGVRFYDFADNEDECTKKMDPRMITWVGISQDENFWRRLVCGIKPEFYYGDIESWPTHYEIRQCIEVWPPPSGDEWKLRIKGYFGLLPLEVDADVNTIDYEAIQLFALANAKAHYGQPDAANYMQQYRDYIGAVTAGSHHTRRYVPNTEQSYPPPLPILTGYPGDP